MKRKSIIAIVITILAVAMTITIWAATCMNCGGFGKVACRNCGGSGQVMGFAPGPFGPVASPIPCPACAQRGLPPQILCPACRGSGQVGMTPSFTGRRKCPWCSCENRIWDGTPGDTGSVHVGTSTDGGLVSKTGLLGINGLSGVKEAQTGDCEMVWGYRKGISRPSCVKGEHCEVVLH